MALSVLIAAIGYRRHHLSCSGAAGAVVLGTVITGFGGVVWGGVLVAFFASSTLLSKYRIGQKSGLAEKFSKGSRRDLAQTLANGGLAGIIAITVGIVGKESGLFPPLAFAFYGALAAANADTWATELGVLARRQPRLITTGQMVPVGTSGAITAEGVAAAFAGATFIGAVTFVLIQVAALVTTGSWLIGDWIVIPLCAAGGLAGALIDSFLGATGQAIYYCAVCHTETEQPLHRCGRPTSLQRGLRWMDNDWVNFLASLLGATVASLIGMLLWTQP